jgi:hypothetical protein
MRKLYLTLVLLVSAVGWLVQQRLREDGASGAVVSALVSGPVRSSTESVANDATVHAAAPLQTAPVVQDAPAAGAGPAASGADRPQEWDRFENWLARWRAAGADEKLALEEEGVFLAEERATVLKGLMQIDPKLAFELGIPLRDYVALPPAVQSKMERPFNIQTSFDVLRSMNVDENGVCNTGFPRKGEQQGPSGMVVLQAGSDDQMESYSYGARLAAYPGKQETTLHGYVLGNRQVLGEDSLQRLAVADIEAAVSLFGESSFGRGTSPVSGLPADPEIAAVYGGTVHWFASLEELGQAQALLRAIDTSVNPRPVTRYLGQMGIAAVARAGSAELITPETFAPVQAFVFSGYDRAWTCTPKKVFVAAIRYSQDTWDTNKHVPTLRTITAGVNQYIQQMSRGKSEFEVEVAPSAVVLSKTLYPNETTGLLEQLKNYYRNTLGKNPDDVDIWTSFVETANGAAGIAGKGLAGSWKCWITNCLGEGLWSHEYGHCYGLPHANSWVINPGLTDPLSAAGAHKEYGDQMDIMGSGLYPQGYWRMHALWSIGWRETAEYQEVSAPGIYRIYRFDHPDMGLAESNAGAAMTQGLRIRRGGGVSGQLFSIAHRAKYTNLPTIGRGLQVIWVKENQSSGWYDTSQSHMLDLTPETREVNSDGGLVVGRTFCDPVGGVSITALALRGTEPNVYVETEVKFGPFTGNRAPTGLKLTVPATASARSSLSMSATATDPDGDSLAYHWNFGDGTTAASATAAQTKTFTAGGTYAVKVVVTDKRGGTATATANIAVEDPLRSLSSAALPNWRGGGLHSIRSIGDTALYAMGSYEALYKTTDGTNWTKLSVTGSTGYSMFDAASNGATLVVLATKDADKSVKLFSSQDQGATWNSFVPASAATLSKLIWTGTNFMAFGGNSTNNYVLLSSNGITWSKVTVAPPQAGSWKGAASDGNGNVLMTGSTSGIPIVMTAFSSDHGATWSTFLSSINADAQDCAYFGGDFYAGGWNMYVSKVTGSGRVFTSVGSVKESRGYDFFFLPNQNFALARESKLDSATNLQLTRNGSDWFSLGITGNPAFKRGAAFKGCMHFIQTEIVGGYMTYKVARTTASVTASFETGDGGGAGNGGDGGETAPVILTQPISVVANPGSAASFAVWASGAAPLTYQWSKNGTPITGATNASYVVAAAGAGDAGSYRVAVANSLGTVTSDAATLTLNTPVTITQQPVGRTVAIGGSVSLSVGAAGTGPLTYQWRKDGAVIAGGTAATYTVASAQLIHAGSYAVVVSNVVGSVTSQAATVVVSGPPVVTQQPVGGAFNPGAALNLRVTVSSVSPPTYQWYKNNLAISGATSGSYAVTALQPVHAGTYKVVVTNSIGTTTSASTVVSINSGPSITVQPLSRTVRSGSAAAFSVTAMGTAPFTYQWRKGGVNIPGATSSSYSIAAASVANAGEYSVVVRNVAGTSTSSAAVLTVQVPVAITVQPVGGTINAGSPLSLSVTATGTGPLTYQWFKDAVALAGATSPTYSVPAAALAQWGSYMVKITNAQGTVSSGTANVLIATAPSITLQPAGVAITAGATGTLTARVLNGVVGTYQWKKNGVNVGAAQTLPALVTASTLTLSLPAASDLTEGAYTLALTNPRGTTTSATANVTVNYGAPRVLAYKLSASMATSVTVRNAPVVFTASIATAYNNESLQTTVRGTGTLTYKWYYQGVTEKVPTLIPSQTTATLNFAASAVPKGKAVTYILVVSNALGSTTGKFTVGNSVAPPSASMTIVAQPKPASVPEGGSATLSVVLSGAPVSYTWYRVEAAGVLDTVPAPSAPDLVLPSVSPSSVGEYFVVATDRNGGSVSSATAKILVLPAGD